MAAKFEIYKSSTQYRWRLKAANGEIVASGEAYKTKAGAKDGIDAVKRAAASATVDDTTGGVTEQFVLVTEDPHRTGEERS